MHHEPELIMSMSAEPVILGIDVSKAWLDINVHGHDHVERIDNKKGAIKAFLKKHRGALVAIESTNTYHREAVACAHALGMTTYLLSGLRLKKYGEAIGQRHRNDPIDAKLLARYLARERSELKPYLPRAYELEQLWMLLKRRASLVQTGVAETQRFSDFEGFADVSREIEKMHKALKAAIKAIDLHMNALIKKLGYTEDAKRLATIPGVGPLNAAMLLARFHAGDFPTHDAFVAFLGMDVRAKDSGKLVGKRKLTKHGDGEARRLIYLAAETASREGQFFHARYQALIARGIKPTAAHIIIARKIVKIAFALLSKGLTFDPSRVFRRPAAAGLACTPDPGASDKPAPDGARGSRRSRQRSISA